MSIEVLVRRGKPIIRLSRTFNKKGKKKIQVIKIKKNIKSVLLVNIFMFSFLSPILTLADPVPSINYNWQEENFQFTLDRVWTGDSNVINFTGTYSDVITTKFSNYNETDNTMTRETRTTYYDANYSIYNNKTIKGYIDITMNLDVYRVNVQYGKSVQLVWMALKEGSYEVEYYLEQSEEDFEFIEDNYQEIESQFTKTNLTSMEVIDTWSEDYNKTENINMTVNREPTTDTQYILYDVEFSMPIVLSMQIFSTKNNDRIAWAEMFYDFIIFKDKDNDGIYSAGETSNPSHGEFNIQVSDESIGRISPQVVDWRSYRERTDLATNITTNRTSHYVFPHDKTVTEIASTIQFSPPNQVGDTVSWNIEYPQYPTAANVIDHDKNPSSWYLTDPNSTYDLSSPGDYNYQFDYTINDTQADLDFTLDMSKISNDSLYDAVQGYGLSLPHYNFFLSSFDINEVDPTELTVPSDIFTFESNGTLVAAIDMLNPAKKNYTLYDYPEMGTNTLMESGGGSVHKLLVSNHEQMGNYGNPFLNLVYSIEDIVAADPTFDVVDSLYKIETQNYPVWNGEHLSHDPTFTIYFEEQTGEETPTDPDASILGFDVFIVLAFASTVVVIILTKQKKRMKTKI